MVSKTKTKKKAIDKVKNIKIQVDVTGYGFDGKVAPDEISCPKTDLVEK